MKALTSAERSVLACLAVASPVLTNVLHEIDESEEMVIQDLVRSGRATMHEHVDEDGDVWSVYTATAAGRLALRLSCIAEVPT